MRKLSTLLLGLLFATFAFGKSVTLEQANQVANKYFSATSLKSAPAIANSFSKSYNGIITYYVFNYAGGGFVVVSADDAVTPILAQSDEGYIETEISNPATRFWFDNYSKEIAHIVAAESDNNETLKEWSRILNNDIKAPMADVAPLLNTKWNQDQYYNYYCPAAVTGPDGKTYAGCVATTMGQIMKYYNFPVKGVGSHSYNLGKFGTISADFGSTNYNFAGMGNTATGSSYQEIAKLLYHAGVSVNMNYAADGSGASNASVPEALTLYFNYDNSTIGLAYQADDPNKWIELLKKELDAHRPLYYSGVDVSDPQNPAGHAWVCDGYRNSDGKFHMNWGWGGFSNGYFAIGALNSGNGIFNTSNAVVYGIKPGNPNLIVRFPNLKKYNPIAQVSSFAIDCSVVTGTPTAVNLYIDKKLVFTTVQTNFTYTWNTTEATLGTYAIRLEAIDATDTVYQEVYASLSEWIPQASGFTSQNRYIQNINAVDSLVVWATAVDGNGDLTINEFTKTNNGGKTWIPGKVLGGLVYGLGNICGLDSMNAFVSVYHKTTQDNTCGVYKTTDGGLTWTQLPGALQGDASFADNVWFWNKNEGMCHGDVKDNYFEIYTTSNGGSTWTRVPKANIGAGANPVSGEGGWTSVIQAVGANTIMFGTNKGNLYISHDKGLHWIISNTGISPVTSGVQKICFKDDLNGLVAQTTTTSVLRATNDGGTTWKTIKPIGPYKESDMVYVPGTDNTYVTTGAGASYSFDGGYSWSQAGGTEIQAFTSVAFFNNRFGWAGGLNKSSTENGMNKYLGVLVPASVQNPVSELTAVPVELSASLTWKAPVVTPLSYNIYRNDTLRANTTTNNYLDSPVAKGIQTYCVTAVYDHGESLRTCTNIWIALGVANTDVAAYRVYPNPAKEVINIITPVRFNEVKMFNTLGKVVYHNDTKDTNLHILTEGFEPGMYILQIYTGTIMVSKKVLIVRY
jgi:photosystem II stability/assembly factor-like uncharacterized protein